MIEDNISIHANGNQKKAGVDRFLSDIIDFKPKPVTRGKRGHYVMVNGSIHQEDIIIVKIYVHTSEQLNI